MKTCRYSIGCAALAGALLSGPALAQSEAIPGGPWVTPNQEIRLDAYESYEQLTSRLVGIKNRARRPMMIESIAVTAGNRDVWLVKLGDPNNTPVMIITQQHGDEPHGTEAVLDLIQKLAMEGGGSKSILDHLYVLVVPRVNPDGTTYPDRGNGDIDAPVRNSRSCFDEDGNVDPNLIDDGRGVFTDRFVSDRNRWHYDINRYHWGDWSQSNQILCNPGLTGRHFDPTVNPVPEAQGIIDAYNDHGPIWVVDVHNQGPSVVDPDAVPQDNEFRPGRLVTGSILWPTNDNVADQAVDLSKQMTLVMKKRSIELGNMEITRYVGGDFPGIARNAYGLLGTERLNQNEQGPLGGSVLVEILGQTEGSLNFNLGQKAIGMLKNNARELLEAVLEATADGSLFDEDPADVDTLILPNDINIGNPRREEEDEESEAHAAE